ncbi:MAG TPA: 50S ribosomal protein L10 [Thermomicrobiales bacterium]|nr:50S ribosomal protein L10 [Thermomicrobiales bacterium]
MPTPKKVAAVAEIREMLSRANLTVVADYRGLTVADVQAFRAALRPLNGQARVVKNTLTTIAAREAGKEQLAAQLTGPTMLVVAYDDVVSVAKAVGDFARTSRILKVRGGLVGQQVVDEAGLTAIATLPSREVLLARVVGQMQAPLYGLVGVLSGAIRQFAYVLQARIDQLGGAAEAPAEAPAGD